MKKTISILSKLENISHIEKLVDEISEECNLSSDLYGKVLIATIYIETMPKSCRDTSEKILFANSIFLFPISV